MGGTGRPFWASCGWIGLVPCAAHHLKELAAERLWGKLEDPENQTRPARDDVYQHRPARWSLGLQLNPPVLQKPRLAARARATAARILSTYFTLGGYTNVVA